MPKKMGFLYEKMLDKVQIRQSIINNCKHKTKRKEVIEIMDHIDDYVDKLYELLRDGTYAPAEPRYKTIYDKCSGKLREISIIPFFPDSCIQRLVVDVMRPALTRGMYPHSCASIPKKGSAHAMKYLKRAMRNPKGTKYAAKLDIRQYYPSIKIELVMEKLRRKIKDEKFLRLVESVISVGKDDGLNIGFYINQWLANYLLEEVDWKIIAADRVTYYVRNMDDMILTSPNKRKLQNAVNMIDSELKAMGLALKGNKEVFEVDSRGIDFVGYRFFHDRVIMRRRNSLRLMRRLRKVRNRMENGQPISPTIAAGTLSMIGQLKHCNSQHFKEKYVYGLNIKELKNIVRNRV